MLTGSQVQRVTSSGFDLSGLDFHTGGTLGGFLLLPPPFFAILRRSSTSNR